MKPLSILPDESLSFHLADALEAASAMPSGEKAIQYIQEAHACQRELLRRATIRSRRAIVAEQLDRLSLPLRSRRYWHTLGRTAHRGRARDAAYSLAFLKVCHPA